MKNDTRKDIVVSLIIALAASLPAQWFWLACERLPPPKILENGMPDSIICDDRPLILMFNGDLRSKIFLFVCIFIYTFSLALISRRILRSKPKSELAEKKDKPEDTQLKN
ncbi:Uncharacterised protein [uncultured archaeon]|nr:Uncharacterised protein [uncultured archaeon]